MVQEDQKFHTLVHRMNAAWQLLRTWVLKGGISAQVTGLEILQSDGHIIKLIVREHGDLDLQRNPHIAADEFKLLNLLHSENVSVPKPYHLVPDGELFLKPALVIEYIEGKANFAPSNMNEYTYQLAVALSQLHRIDCSCVDVSFLPLQIENYNKLLVKDLLRLDSLLNNSDTLEKIHSFLRLPSCNKVAILHGDFWPGNLLWNNGQLISLIDWEDAAVGDPLADLANGRLEFLFHFGEDAMNCFTNHYQAMMPTVDYSHLAYWDVFAALRLCRFSEWGLDEETVKMMHDKHRFFVTQAINRLIS